MYLDVEKVLHTIQNLECRAGHDLHAVYRRLLNKRSNSLIRGGAVVRLITGTSTETKVSTVTALTGRSLTFL